MLRPNDFAALEALGALMGRREAVLVHAAREARGLTRASCPSSATPQTARVSSLYARCLATMAPFMICVTE